MSVPARLRAAVVGAGRMGMVHGHLLQIHPETELVAFVDRDTGLADHLASQGLRAKLYPSLEEAYAETAPDAHCVATDDSGSAYVCDPGKGRLLVFRDPYPATR